MPTSSQQEQLAEVRIVICTGEPSMGQLRAWRALWAKLLSANALPVSQGQTDDGEGTAAPRAQAESGGRRNERGGERSNGGV